MQKLKKIYKGKRREACKIEECYFQFCSPNSFMYVQCIKHFKLLIYFTREKLKRSIAQKTK
jgi:hypothetical protein